MQAEARTLSLTRPSEPRKEYGSNVWQFNAGLALAAAGLMLLMVFFVVSAVVSGWVSDLTNPGETNVAALAGRITAYDSWLFPVATASVALIKVGIAITLWGIVRRLWVRVEAVKESLPVLTERGSAS